MCGAMGSGRPYKITRHPAADACAANTSGGGFEIVRLKRASPDWSHSEHVEQALAKPDAGNRLCPIGTGQRCTPDFCRRNFFEAVTLRPLVEKVGWCHRKLSVQERDQALRLAICE